MNHGFALVAEQASRRVKDEGEEEFVHRAALFVARAAPCVALAVVWRMLFYEERTARTGSCSARTRDHHQDSSSKGGMGGEPIAPFVAWRKRAAKAAD